MLSMPEVTLREDDALSDDELVPMVTLLDRIWPSEDRPLEKLIELFPQLRTRLRISYRGCTRASMRHLIWEGDEVVAHALTFERPIRSDEGELPVMALSAVCVSPDHRGRGLGAAVVRSAFQRVESGEFPVSLFQTPIPDFYEKLGSVSVSNRFVDSRNRDDRTANPWRDSSIMIYPAGYAWPEGVIDLNGPGY
jgi:GNAT superfamily N-acetyltransferase